MKIIRKRISEIDSRERKIIKELIRNNLGLIFHDVEFNEIVSSFLGSRLSYLLVYNKGVDLIGICPIHTFRRGILKISFSNPTSHEVPYGGWVYNKNRTNIIELLKHMKLSPNESLTYSSKIQIDNDEHKYPSRYKVIPSQTAIIDLSLSEDNIWKDVIHSKRRNMIRKALKSGIKVKYYGPDGFDVYYELMIDTHQRTGFKSRPKNYYYKILESYFEKKKAAVLVAEKDNYAVAGMILIGNRNVMHYWQSVSRKGVMNMGQGELLQWEAIRWAKKNGCSFYDLCIVEPKRLPNIAKFKLGFSDRMIEFKGFVIKSAVFRVLNKLNKFFFRKD